MVKLRGLKISGAAALVMVLTGCGGGGSDAPVAEAPQPVAQTQEPTSEQPTTEKAASAKPTTEEPTTEEPEPTREGPDTYQVGDLIERPTADITVNVIEERDFIATSSSFEPYTNGRIEPGAGERLWYVDMTWTNNLPEAVGKECHGPYAMQLQAYDLQGREMLMAEQPGMIEGQECSTGLLQGQTGRWQSAFHGLDEEFGWLVFTDYNGEPAAVVLDPDLELYFDDR